MTNSHLPRKTQYSMSRQVFDIAFSHNRLQAKKTEKITTQMQVAMQLTPASSSSSRTLARRLAGESPCCCNVSIYCAPENSFMMLQQVANVEVQLATSAAHEAHFSQFQGNNHANFSWHKQRRRPVVATGCRLARSSSSLPASPHTMNDGVWDIRFGRQVRGN